MTNYRHGQMINLIDEMNSPLLAVEPQRCVLVRHRNGECLRCAAVCTTGAISLGEEGIVVSPEKCIGCGTCASACPTGCLTAANPTDEELFGAVEAALAENEGRVAIACERAFAMASGNRMKQDSCDATAPSFVPGKIAGATSDGRPLVGVVCLGRVDESLLVEATARGARSIQLISGPCESCPHRCGGALSDEIIVSAETLLAALGTPSPIDRIRLQHASDTREILRLRPTASAQDDTNAVNAATVADASEDCLSESGYPPAPPQEASNQIPEEDPHPEFAHIRLLMGAESYYLYDDSAMTDAYARWAFLAAEDDPVATFIECVREESSVYPRPMARENLANDPFRMNAEAVEAAFAEARAQGRADDIERVEASNGDVYFYSTTYLTPRRAQALAEWDAVERIRNV